jgi:hypothetical protein
MTGLTAREAMLVRAAQHRIDTIIGTRKLIDYRRALAKKHPEWTSPQIAEAAIRVARRW